MPRVELLGPHHNRESIDCGQPDLDDAKDGAAQKYYLRYGFLPLTHDPLRLFLPLATLKRALPKP